MPFNNIFSRFYSLMLTPSISELPESLSCKSNMTHLIFTDSDEETPVQRRSHRREEGRDDLPLHNAALHELLAEIMKHKDSWPFIRPVQKNEVTFLIFKVKFSSDNCILFKGT